MGFKESVRSLTFNKYELWDYDLNNLREVEGVSRLDELIDLLVFLRDDEKYHNVCRLADLNSLGDDNNNFHYSIKDVPFHYAAERGLGFSLPFYLPPITKLIDIDSFIVVYTMIQCSYISYSGHRLNNNEDKAIKLSDIMQYISFFVEDFDNESNVLPDCDYGEFFKKLHHLYWEDKKAKKLDAAVYSFYSLISGYNYLPYLFSRTFGRATTYLMGCNALREGRDSIGCDDVVVGYLATFKIILNDIRPLVWDYYDSEKWEGFGKKTLSSELKKLINK